MNPRIRELWDRAANIAKQRQDPNSGSWESEVEFVNLFAELIVQECADIAREYDAPKLSGPGVIIASRIETHFGVEE